MIYGEGLLFGCKQERQGFRELPQCKLSEHRKHNKQGCLQISLNIGFKENHIIEQSRKFKI